MSSLLDKNKDIPEDGRNKYGFIIIAIFMIWLFFPNNNSFIKLSYLFDNIVYQCARITHANVKPGFIHHRNNAISLAKAYPKKASRSLKEMDKAIKTTPTGSAYVKKLHRERALIKLYYGDKAGALEDYKLADELKAEDTLRVGILLADASKFSEAAGYCEKIINYNDEVVSGYICLSYVYEKAGYMDAAIHIYDLLAGLKPDNYMVYKERALLKQRMGDTDGAEEDFKKAKEIFPLFNKNDEPFTEKVVRLKEVPLSLI